MKRFILYFIFLLLVTNLSFSQEVTTDHVTTFFLIRHAEKDRTDVTNKNPELTESGRQRAENWAQFFSQFKISAVYATNYNRTLQTAIPTANSQHLKVRTYQPFEIDIAALKQESKGQNVLIVGHSNTIPSLANLLIGDEIYADIEDTNNANLYIITISGEAISHLLIKTK